MRGAHRIAYVMTYGPPPEGSELDHLCRVRSCVRPDHLEPVAHIVNVIRGDGPMRARIRDQRITHCPHGHEYTPQNTMYAGAKRYRACRECRRQRSRKRVRSQ